RGPGALRVADAGAVDQDVEAAEPLDRGGDRPVDRRLVSHVAGEHVLAGRVHIKPDDLRTADAQRCDGRRADAAPGAGAQDAGAHAVTSTVSTAGAGISRCSAGSNRRSPLKKRNVWSGHSVVFRPLLSRYQLAQPPAVHTVPS